MQTPNALFYPGRDSRSVRQPCLLGLDIDAIFELRRCLVGSLAVARLLFEVCAGEKKNNLSGVGSFQHSLQKASRATRCSWCERPGGVTVLLRCTTAGLRCISPPAPTALPSPSARFLYTSEEDFSTSNKGLRVIFQSRTSKSVAHANIFPSVQNFKSQRPFCWLGLASFQWITAPFFAKSPAGRC